MQGCYVKNEIKSLVKAGAVLDCFGPEELELRAVEISRKLKIPLTTLVRILATLTSMRFIERSAATGKYSIGPRLYAIGSLYLSTTDIFKAADQVVRTLNGITEEQVSVSILEKDNTVLIMREVARYAFRVTTHIGSSVPAYASASGKALLSELTESELDRLYPEEKLKPLTSITVTTKTELKQLLEQIRKTGVSFDKGSALEGVEGISAVVRDAHGTAVAVLSIGFPVFRANESLCNKLATVVKIGASIISYRLGYKDLVEPVRDIQEITSWWKQNTN